MELWTERGLEKLTLDLNHLYKDFANRYIEEKMCNTTGHTGTPGLCTVGKPHRRVVVRLGPNRAFLRGKAVTNY